MIAPNEPGSTRTSSLLGSMAYLNNAQPMSWHQIHELSGEIQRQLTKPGESGQIKSSTMRIDSTTIRYLRISPLIGKILILVFALLAIIGLSFYLSSLKPKVEKRDLADMVNIPTGKYPGPYGFHIKVRGFWIDAHEVTIQEYAAFIKAIASLPEDMQNVYQHEDQPADKTSHVPDDWQALYTAAKEGKMWNKHSMEIYHPVVGVDWWDAYAYAEWKGRSLPSYDDWYAACSASSDPSKLKGFRLPGCGQNRTNHHWPLWHGRQCLRVDARTTLDPADPSAPPRYMITGASYLRPKYGARAREWVDSRSLRRPDIGFRTCNNSRQ